jgi:hypothetical protein
MEQAVENQTQMGKVYKDRQIWAGTFLGGPLVAGYLFAENFKTLDEADKASKAWFYSITATIIIFGSVFFIPDSIKIPDQIIPLIYTGIAYYFFKRLQGVKIAEHLKAGGKVYNWWRLIAISVIGLIITLIPFVGILFISDALTHDPATIHYGKLKHEISFDRNNISEKEIDRIAVAFTQTFYFDTLNQKFVYVKKVDDNYEISLSCSNLVINNSQAYLYFGQLRRAMQTVFPNKIIFNLVVDDLDNVVKRIE